MRRLKHVLCSFDARTFQAEKTVVEGSSHLMGPFVVEYPCIWIYFFLGQTPLASWLSDVH